jgi:hypothetical protein
LARNKVANFLNRFSTITTIPSMEKQPSQIIGAKVPVQESLNSRAQTHIDHSKLPMK